MENQEDQLDSDLFLENIAPMLVSVIIVFLIFAVFMILSYWKFVEEAIKPVYKWMSNMIFWNLTLRYYLEGYLPLTHAKLLQLRAGYKWDSALMIALSLSSIAWLCIYVFGPIFLWKFFSKHVENFREKWFRRRFGDSTNILTHRRRKAALYFLIFCYRRLLIMITLVFVSSKCFQIEFTILTIQFTMLLMGKARPFRYPSQRRLEYFNEVIMLLWCYHMFIFTDFVPSMHIRFQMGYVLIVIVSTCLIVNLMYLYSSLPRRFYLHCKKLYKRIKKCCEKPKKVKTG